MKSNGQSIEPKAIIGALRQPLAHAGRINTTVHQGSNRPNREMSDEW